MICTNNLLMLNLFKTFKFEICNNSFPAKFFCFFLLPFAVIFSLVFFLNSFWEPDIALRKKKNEVLNQFYKNLAKSQIKLLNNKS